MNLKDIKKDIFKKLLSSNRTMEEDVDMFLEDLIGDFGSLDAYAVARISSRVIPLKDRLLEGRLHKSQMFFDGFNAIAAQKSLEWASICKKWNSPQLVGVLNTEIKKFRKNINGALSIARNKAKELTDALDYVATNYSLNKTEHGQINKALNRLEKVLKLTGYL